jgi:hypothetical protein
VRELANTIDRAALLAETSTIDEAALELGPGSAVSRAATPSPPEPGGAPPRSASPAASLEGALRTHLQATLDRHDGNISRAADALGIARNTLRAHIQRLKLRTARSGGGVPLDRDPAHRREEPPARAASPDHAVSPAEPVRSVGGERPRTPAASPEATPLPAPLGRSDRPTMLRWERQLLTFLAVALTPPRGASPLQLAPVLQDLVGLLERFGGRVDELTPLRIAGTFGAEPVEDAPRRAAAAALAAMKALERDPHGVVARAALEVADRLVSRAGQVTGMDPAERLDTRRTMDDLLASAAPGEILVGAPAVPHLDRSFELAARSDLTAEGRAAHRLLPRERSGLLVAGHGPSPFVGRASELATLLEALDRAERGHGQIVGVVGEPGVGKSRLLHEFRLALRPERAAYWLGRCVSYGESIPYLPIVEVPSPARWRRTSATRPTS